jgi:hypothetical protein
MTVYLYTWQSIAGDTSVRGILMEYAVVNASASRIGACSYDYTDYLRFDA